jgi:hypothetical protein
LAALDAPHYFTEAQLAAFEKARPDLVEPSSARDLAVAEFISACALNGIERPSVEDMLAEVHLRRHAGE